MFTDRLIEIARRKERLVARSEQQRIVIAAACVQWRKPFGVIDRGIAVAHYLKTHPLALGAGVAVAVVASPRRVLRWAGRGLFVWRAWRSLGAWARKPVV